MCPLGWRDRPTTNQRRPRQRRGIDERDDVALYDSSPGHRRGTTWKICLAVPSTAPRAFLIMLPNRRIIPRVPYSRVINSLEILLLYQLSCKF